ncbi:MAG: ABC transporter substrate binding protein [Woeseia sp.]
MPEPRGFNTVRFRLLSLLLLLQVGGCALLSPPPEEPPPQEVPAPPPAPPPQQETPAPAPVPRPEPVPEPPPPPAPTTYAPPVAVVLSSRAPAYERVALALGELLENREIYDLSDRSLSPRDAFARITEFSAGAIVAIGLRAAVYARDYTTVPVVYAQVFNATDNELGGERIRGVAVLPPLDKQLAAWREIAPGLASVGAIVGPGHDALLDEARQAASANELRFESRIANSDREALYHFNRMIPSIDAFWLFPDNRILSPSVLTEMMDYAARHGVQVAVFSDNLLELGATLSTTADEDDIARTIMLLLNRIHDGGIKDIPAISPLNQMRISFGPAAEPSR